MDDKLVNRAMGRVIESLTTNEDAPRTILLVGQPSSGKSALVNLLKSAFVGYHDEMEEVETSNSSKQPFTRHLRFLKSMGLCPREMESFRQRYNLPANTTLPNIIDMPGLYRINETKFKYVLEGKIPADSEIFTSLSGDTSMPPVDMSLGDDMKVDCVLFVASTIQDVPQQLFEDVMNIIQINHGKLRKLPFLLVFTHNDKETPEHCVTKRRFVAGSTLGISLQMKMKSVDVSNYSDRDPISYDYSWRYQTDLDKHYKALMLISKLLNIKKVVGNIDHSPELNPYWDHLILCSKTFWEKKALRYVILILLFSFFVTCPIVFLLLTGIVILSIIILCY